MAQFFIVRPVFAWVVAFFISIAGLIALPFLPVAQYPKVAPPQLSISTAYPGAAPAEIYQGVTRQIEDELNGVKGMAYFESTSDATGQVEITATFRTGVNIDIASVNAQNAIRRVQPRLPATVVQQGINTEESGAGFLMIVSLTSTDGKFDDVALGDYLNRNVLGEIRRIPGVGRAQLFASPRSMRIWIDPGKMLGLNITTDDIAAAIRAQNAQVAAGKIGADPNPITQQITATVLVKGQLTTPEEFGDIVLRANPDGSTVRLRDVARVEVGSESYNFATRLNGKPSAAIAVQLSESGNAVATSTAVRERMKELSKFFPKGIEYSVPYDTSPFVEASIEKVVHTLVEAVILVFLVMFLFLQNFRYTVIPALVVPVALLGTLAVMLAAGFSINVLTMFAMVLAIGILVDDAIVVVENVERIMAEEGLPPLRATQKAMGQISGAIVGITLVLAAVFVPMAFFPGATGVIYRQFSLTMVVSILFSAFLALSLTPALCATFLKPPADHARQGGFFGAFNRFFDRTTRRYAAMVTGATSRVGRLMVIFLAIAIGSGWLFMRLPTAFIPNEDQGFIIVDIQTPPEASSNRTLQAIRQIEAIARAEAAVSDIVAVRGFSFSGAGQNAAIMFISLKDWSRRGAGEAAQDIANRMNVKMFGISDVMAFALSPPPIQGFGTSAGFSFRLQDRAGLGQQALAAAAQQLMAEARKSPVLTGMRMEGLPDAAQLTIIIDREKANTFGVSFAAINNTITTALGSSYINDFPNNGRMQRVIIQSDAAGRMQAEDLMKLNVRNASGGMVPLSAFARAQWQKGPQQIIGYNGYPSVRISGAAAPGYSSGDAIAEIERIAATLQQGIGYEWTGQTLEEIASGAQAPILFALSILFVFLLLAALYESWSIPLSVMLVVPLGVIGCILAVMLRGLPNDLYFKVGLLAIIGLSAKNAILIIEFAKDLHAQGMGLREAATEAARLRFRPILMTSLAFTLGVVPLAIATGPSAASQNAIGTGVVGGMISATVLAVIFVPVFFVAVLGIFRPKRPAPAGGASGGDVAKPGHG
ncbi:multidrug efflux RND transporter permease subunit [Camelimonas abortus]|uniref:Efflux pump membrane transporter n=1 Tax=Camelimonas abortus TaxID=1017184 RepID=A0ABV7LA95_9HYPH